MAQPSSLNNSVNLSDVYSENIEHRIFTEKVKLLYSNGYGVVTGAFVIYVIFAIAIWQVNADPRLIHWIAIYTLVAIARLAMIYIYSTRANKLGKSNHFWVNLFVLGIVVSGLFWGIAVLWFLDPSNPLTIAIVVTFTLGIATGAVSSTAIYYPAYFAFLIPGVFPLAGVLLLSGGSITAIGLAICIYILGGTHFARQFNRTILDSLHLRFQNLDLIEEVTLQKDRAEVEKSEAEQANVSKSRFLASTSHDLRQPLHALGLLVSVMETETDPVIRKSIFEQIKSSVSALDGLFNSLLDISKLDAGTVEFSEESFYLSDFFDDLSQEFFVLADQKNIDIHFQESSVCVYTDPVLLERIVRNILSNAIRFTEKGKVLVGVRRKSDHVVLCIFDQGVGIPEHEMESVFNEYIQLQNPERDRNKGLGLGLAIVRRLCDLMGHSVSLNSKFGKGTEFKLSIPYGEVENIVDDEVDELIINSNLARTIMVIDDETAILDSMKLLLSNWKCTVLAADSIANAVNMVEEFEGVIDIVISDYRLRDNTNGIDAMNTIKSVIPNEVKGILITGDTAPAVLHHAKSSGFLVLHKPVKPAQLRLAISIDS